MKRQALGRGLSALLSEEYREIPDQIAEIDVDTLTPNDLVAAAGAFKLSAGLLVKTVALPAAGAQ